MYHSKFIKPFIIGSFLLLSANPLFSQTGNSTNLPGKEMGIDIRPVSFDFHLERGKQSVKTITITNSQDLPAQLNFYLGDWVRDTLGDHIYYPAGTLAKSCAAWTKLSRTFVEVPPKGSMTFDLTLSVPDSAGAEEAMRWSMLFVEAVDETKLQKASGNQIATNVVRKQRIGLHIYQTPPALTEKAIKMISFQTVASEKNGYRITCENTGALQVHCKTYLELAALDESNKVYKVPGKEFPIFPGQRRMVYFTIPPDIPKGRFNVLAAVDAGEDVPLEAAQAEITIN